MKGQDAGSNYKFAAKLADVAPGNDFPPLAQARSFASMATEVSKTWQPAYQCLLPWPSVPMGISTFQTLDRRLRERARSCASTSTKP